MGATRSTELVGRRVVVPPTASRPEAAGPVEPHRDVPTLEPGEAAEAGLPSLPERCQAAVAVAAKPCEPGTEYAQ